MPGTGTSKRSSAGSELRARVNAARDPETAGRTARGANGAEDPTARTAPRITAVEEDEDAPAAAAGRLRCTTWVALRRWFMAAVKVGAM